MKKNHLTIIFIIGTLLATSCARKKKETEPAEESNQQAIQQNQEFLKENTKFSNQEIDELTQTFKDPKEILRFHKIHACMVLPKAELCDKEQPEIYGLYRLHDKGTFDKAIELNKLNDDAVKKWFISQQPKNLYPVDLSKKLPENKVERLLELAVNSGLANGGALTGGGNQPAPTAAPTVSPPAVPSAPLDPKEPDYTAFGNTQRIDCQTKNATDKGYRITLDQTSAVDKTNLVVEAHLSAMSTSGGHPVYDGDLKAKLKYNKKGKCFILVVDKDKKPTLSLTLNRRGNASLNKINSKKVDKKLKKLKCQYDVEIPCLK